MKAGGNGGEDRSRPRCPDVHSGRVGARARTAALDRRLASLQRTPNMKIDPGPGNGPLDEQTPQKVAEGDPCKDLKRWLQRKLTCVNIRTEAGERAAAFRSSTRFTGFASFAVLLIAAGMTDDARSGHEFPVYPSYYPHEIRIETMDPDRAAALLLEGKIQAYIGPEPNFTTAAPESIRAIESLGSLVIVRVNPESPLARDHDAACVLARTVVREIAARHDQLRFHPYPITPYDGDYLYHADLADAARARFIGKSAAAGAAVARRPRARASGALAKSLLPAGWYTQAPTWDVEIDEVSAAELAASATKESNGWISPRWARSGWARTALLLAPAEDARQQVRVQADLDRLESGAYRGTVERINLERELVSTLASSCRSIVAGYTVKREYISAEYSAGIENIAFDSITGLNSPIFVRTVKLKDFPWNGWLSLGIDTRPAAAWNPIAGFSDPFGRLMWNAIGDPALLPSPNGAGWMLNRISDVR